MINLAQVGNQAGQFQGCVEDLNAAIGQMRSYQSSLNACWSAREMAYVNQEIDHICLMLQNSARDLGGLASDVRRAGQAVKAEQDAAAARQREAERKAAEKKAAEKKNSAPGAGGGGSW